MTRPKATHRNQLDQTTQLLLLRKKVYSVKVENDTENTEVEPTDPAEALRLERLKKQKEKQQEFLKMQQKRKAEEELKVGGDDLGDLLVEGGDEMWEALSQMP